jgi:hypothetical protein
MKTLLLTALLSLGSLTVGLAQTEKGRWAADGQVGFSYSSQRGSEAFSANFLPSAGYFVAPNFLIGSGVSYSYGRITDTNVKYRFDYYSLGLSPFVRYYVGQATLRPYAGLSASLATSRYYSELGPSSQGRESRGRSTVLIPTVGLAYFVNRTASVNAGLNFVRTWSRGSNNIATGQLEESPVSVSNQVTLGIGFQLFFGK